MAHIPRHPGGAGVAPSLLRRFQVAVVNPSDSGSREASVTSCRVFLGAALALVLASASIAQTLPEPQADPQPTFRLQVWGYIVADFSTRVHNYYELRATLEEGLP